ncbi:DUF4865 family protein [Streptomyces sp. NBC_00154]|uniref:DUF4865 family protein n=1 Tax=Streptomyces sp. NBC_00154 TaxID=2975670 RepID=UPI00225B2D4A|nr:DUF4865 family protein [Streptomyces sp. NBC_00154]MCX5314934.1 DUF4865 family protein [Streptomyces sp. NBC_00154]
MGTLPRTATRHRVPIPASMAPAEAVEAAPVESGTRAKAPGAVAAAPAVDPCHWELLHFTLWEHDAPEAPGEHYEVLHLSMPERERLGESRQW